MPKYIYTVVVETDTLLHAEQVMSERINHDEEYEDPSGLTFDYQIEMLYPPIIETSRQEV